MVRPKCRGKLPELASIVRFLPEGAPPTVSLETQHRKPQCPIRVPPTASPTDTPTESRRLHVCRGYQGSLLQVRSDADWYR